MTKQDVQQLVGAILFGIVLYLFTRDPIFALSLPLGLYLFYFLAGRAFGASWILSQDEEEATFRKPTAMRAFFGVMTLASAGGGRNVDASLHFGKRQGGCFCGHLGLFCSCANNLTVYPGQWSNGDAL